MKKGVGLLGILILICSCESLPKAPLIERCVTGDDFLFLCHDSRLDVPDYDLEYAVNYLCTNPSDFKAYQEYVQELRRDLTLCRKRRRKRK